MIEHENITNSLAHTKWNCKYHIVFAPKYRREVFFAEKRLEIRENIAEAVCMERSRSNRGRDMSGSLTYAGKYPAQNERFGIYGIFEGKE